MSRTLSPITVLAAGVSSFVLLSGCANFQESRTVNRFQSAWNEQDLGRLRSQSSEKFQRIALYRNDIQNDLKQLNLPKEKLSVTSVEKTNGNRKKVRVSIDGSKREMQFLLLKEKTTGKWVVDDVLMKQRRSRGLKVVRSVSEQMNLLQSVRDFREAWSQGNRHRMLSMLSPDLRNNLSSLPRGYFQKLSKSVSEKMKNTNSRKPKAELNGEAALVSIRGVKGKVILQMKSNRDHWQIEDFALEGNNREDHIPSMKKLTQVLDTTVKFLDAYARSDLQTLERVSQRDLYGGGLSAADLRSVPLPTSSEAQKNYNVILKKHRAEFVIDTKDNVVKLSLLKDIAPTEKSSTKDFVVSEVTIYDKHSPQKTELTSAFTSHAIVEVFQRKLAQKDIRYLKNLSTKDFNNRVWNELDASLIDQLPFDATISASLQIVKSDYQGALSRIHVLQGIHPMVYILRKEGGRILVDDIESSKPGFEKSLKSVMQAMIPVRKFSIGVNTRNPDILRRVSSKDFNRLIWDHVHELPPTALFIPKHLQASLHSIKKIGNDVVVNLGETQWGARVKLVEEYGKFLIDDIQLISGKNPDERLMVKKALRTEVSNGIRTLTKSRRQPNGTYPKPHELATNFKKRGVTASNGSISQFHTQEKRTLPENPFPRSRRVKLSGFDRVQQHVTTNPRSATFEARQPPTMPPSLDNSSMKRTESILPDRNAFRMNRKLMESPPNGLQNPPTLERLQQPPINIPTHAGSIPVSRKNPFDVAQRLEMSYPTTHKSEVTNPQTVPTENRSSQPNTNSKVPLWDAFPGSSPNRKTSNSNLSDNRGLNWESQKTDHSTDSQNRRAMAPDRSEFENRRMQPNSVNPPLNHALNPYSDSGNTNGRSGLQLAPGIPAGNRPVSPVKTPLPVTDGSGTR